MANSTLQVNGNAINAGGISDNGSEGGGGGLSLSVSGNLMNSGGIGGA